MVLDVMGIVLEPEELVNTIFYLREGELGDDALSGISIVTMLCDFLRGCWVSIN